jgi:hypothetical protein
LRRLGSTDARGVLEDRPSKSFEPSRHEGQGTSGWSVDWSAPASRDYFRLQRQQEAIVLGWSTALPLASLLHLLEAELAEPIRLVDSEVAVSDWSVGSWRSGAATCLADELRCGWRPYETALLSSPGITVQWRTAEFPRHVDERVLSGDLHVRFALRSLPDAPLIRDLITLTATPRVGRELAGGSVFEQLAKELASIAHAVHDESPLER